MATISTPPDLPGPAGAVPPRITSLDYGRPLPAPVLALVRRGLSEGEDFLDRVIDNWHNPFGPYRHPGARFFVAWQGDEAAGMAGLMRDRHLDDPRTGRLQHVYVRPDRRRAGIAEALVRQCLAVAPAFFDRLRLRAATPDAARLYERLGFLHRPDEPNSTHVMALQAPS